MSRVISDTLTSSAVDSRGDELTAPVRFIYDSADPYCVTMDCTGLNAAAHRVRGESVPGDPHKPILWGFARSLLTDALVADGRFGLADVVVERCGAWVAITLTSPDGKAQMRFAHLALLRFAQRTAALVPLGRESEHVDVDAAIAKLLGGVR